MTPQDPPPRQPRQDVGPSWGAISLFYLVLALLGVALAYVVTR